MTPDPAIATAADYADAMIVARRAKNILVLLILLMLLGQLTIFFLVRFDVLTTLAANGPTTAPATQPSRFEHLPHYLASGCLFLGAVLPILLGFVLLLVVNIMLVGRLIGVARVTGAYLWSLILLLLLFPWQAFLDNFGVTIEQAPYKLPGVLYSWTELVGRAHFDGDIYAQASGWIRFLVFPLIAVLVLLIVQAKSNRGIRQALGEETTSTPESNA